MNYVLKGIMAESGGKTKRSKSSRLALVGEVKLRDFANAKLNSTSVSRMSKSTGTVAAKSVSREDKNWWECELEDFLADSEEEITDGQEEDQIVVAPQKKLVESVGIDYPSDIWYLIGAYVYPESVGNFASICRDSGRVLQSPGFWRHLHSRFFRSVPDLDESFRPEAMRRMYSLRTYVIRSLHHFYPVFVERRHCQLALTLAPETSNVMKLCRGKCAAVWHQLIEGPGGRRTFEFFFKFVGATGMNPLESKTLQTRSSGEESPRHVSHSWMSVNPRLGLLRNIWANPEAGCCLLKIVATQYTCVPPSIFGWRLSEISLGLGQDMCKHRVKLFFVTASQGPTAYMVLGQSLQPASTAFLLCDFQECFRQAADDFQPTAEVARRLVSGAKLLGIPLLVTEQYPKGLGKTIAELDISHAEVVEKTNFTMVTEQFRSAHPSLFNGAVRSAVVFGIETHVCVQQTVLDLLNQSGLEVFVVADGCTSRSKEDKRVALERMRQAGAIVTTYESVLLQLIGGKDHPNFKEISQMIRVLPTPKL